MLEEDTTDGDETTDPTASEEEEEEEPEDTTEGGVTPIRSPPEVIKQLKPDPEDDLLRRDVKQNGNLDWIEEAFDAEYEQPKLTPALAVFIRKGYDKLGRKLGQELMGDGLSMAAKTISGLSHAFVKLDLSGKAITEIRLLRNFCNLRYVCLAGNHIFDIAPLNELQFLMTLDVSDNYLDSLEDFQVHNHLKTLNVSKNFLKDLKGVIEHPYLQRLYLSYNKLSIFTTNSSSKYLRELETLELRKNRLTSFGEPGLKLPALKYLFLAQNHIEALPFLKSTRSLEFLDLRRNKLKVTGDWATLALKYLNISFNYIEEVAELEKMAASLPQLEVLVATNNPLMADERAQTLLVVAFKTLTRFNAVNVTKELRVDAVAELAEDGDGNEASVDEIM
ncbi:putative Leucine-rich repeat-containing protein 23 [Hypsibius exemplaris]|uniref:Leucine-rich repeat-containing protein 23 n=1 Tax=Hypsibius exemplaris TaxID=2072580 RepID=A0A1W0WST5_HYPEX|nr:putative Leucine-rich repeat-containing protein 23 [Hypsibius exemplaris]